MIIAADGGGVKGLAALLMLQRIFQSIKNDGGLPAVPKPCEYFDMIGGTSTGGYVNPLNSGKIQPIEYPQANCHHAGTVGNVN